MINRQNRLYFSKYAWMLILMISILLPAFYFIKSYLEEDLPLHPFNNWLLPHFVVTFVSATAINSCNVWLFNSLQNTLPWQKNVGKRLSIELSTIIFYTSTIAVITSLSFHSFFPCDNLFLETYLNVFKSTILNLMVISVLEGVVLFREWKKSLIMNERLEKENILSQYETFKNQLSPHFLFNSLNALSSLMHQDLEKADRFIDEFSVIYRYLLEKKKQFVYIFKRKVFFLCLRYSIFVLDHYLHHLTHTNFYLILRVILIVLFSITKQ